MPLAFGCNHPAGTRVVLGMRGFIIGSLVAHAAFNLILVVFAGAPQQDAFYFLFMALLVFIFSAVVVLPVAVIFGAPTALALRRVHSQTLHVLAFFAAGLLPGLLLFPGNPQLGLISGAAAGIGRLSVWRLARIEHEPAKSDR